MTNEPGVQQNLDSTAKQEKINQSAASKAARFKPGFDKRRWLNGRGKKSPEQREGDEILRAVIWEELSREFNSATMKPLESTETIDALRLMVRTWIKKNPLAVAERIAGKVSDKLDLSNSDGSLKPETLKPSEIAARVLALLDAQKKDKDADGN